MMNYRTRLAAAAGAVATAAVIATTGVMAATAAPRPAASGAESFQIMSTSASGPASVIASGAAFTAARIDKENQKANTAKLTFPNGTVSLKHSSGTGTHTFNPKTCLLTINFHGTYTYTGGTGAYAGITGGGTYKLSVLGIAASVSGKCSLKSPPLAYHQVVDATGTASL